MLNVGLLDIRLFPSPVAIRYLLSVLRHLSSDLRPLISAFQNAEEQLRFDKKAAKLPDEREKKGVMEIVTSWMEKGIERGMQQGMQQGMLQKAHEDILDVLEARFGEAPYELRERILAVTQEAELKRLHRQSALAESMAAFRAKL